MGSTTYKEFRSHFEKDRALLRRFQKIDIAEPSKADTIKIMQGLKPYFEEHHNVEYTNEAISAAVDLSSRYISDRKLPDKAIDVIDEVGAAQMLLPKNKRKKRIDVKDVEQVVAIMARIPPKSVSRDDKKVMKNLAKDLKRVVFVQEKAIDALAASIKLARAGLRERGREPARGRGAVVRLGVRALPPPLRAASRSSGRASTPARRSVGRPRGGGR